MHGLRWLLWNLPEFNYPLWLDFPCLSGFVFQYDSVVALLSSVARKFKPLDIESLVGSSFREDYLGSARSKPIVVGKLPKVVIFTYSLDAFLFQPSCQANTAIC